MNHPSTRLLLTAAAAFLGLTFTGCNSTQLTSGKQYLGEYPLGKGSPRDSGSTPTDLDRLVAEVAAIEPNLHFPARIGLARIEHGLLSAIPPDEDAQWIRLAAELGDGFGEFVPLNRIVSEMVYANHAARSRPAGGIADAVARIRLGAARQHLDLVLVYEIADRTELTPTELTILDWTLIGAYAPTNRARSQTHATALLLDVRTGYPYGSALASADDTFFAATLGADADLARRRQSTRHAAVESLTREVASMFTTLRDDLAAAGAAADPQLVSNSRRNASR